MSKKYIFEGYSDDTFGEYGISNIDHDDSGAGSIRAFIVSRPGGEGVLITGQYRENGCWHIGVSLLDESRPLVLADGWKFSLLPTSYNNELLVYAPADAEVTRLDDEEGSHD